MPNDTKSSPPRPGSAAAVLDSILRNQAAAFQREYAALQDSDDIEHPHRARVALRRFRAALSGFAPVLNEPAARRLSRRARALFRMLGPLRDADVAADSFGEGDERHKMLARAATIREETRQKLAAGGAAGFSAAVEDALASTSLLERDGSPQRLADADAALLGAQALQTAWTAACAYGEDLSHWDDFTRHEFRKDLKTLRYLSEFFSETWTGKARAAFLSRLEKLQESLGEMNDIAVHFSNRDLDERTRRRAAKAMQAAENHWRKLRAIGPWWL